MVLPCISMHINSKFDKRNETTRNYNHDSRIYDELQQGQLHMIPFCTSARMKLSSHDTMMSVLCNNVHERGHSRESRMPSRSVMQDTNPLTYRQSKLWPQRWNTIRHMSFHSEQRIWKTSNATGGIFVLHCVTTIRENTNTISAPRRAVVVADGCHRRQNRTIMASL